MVRDAQATASDWTGDNSDHHPYHPQHAAAVGPGRSVADGDGVTPWPERAAPSIRPATGSSVMPCAGCCAGPCRPIPAPSRASARFTTRPVPCCTPCCVITRSIGGAAADLVRAPSSGSDADPAGSTSERATGCCANPTRRCCYPTSPTNSKQTPRPHPVRAAHPTDNCATHPSHDTRPRLPRPRFLPTDSPGRAGRTLITAGPGCSPTAPGLAVFHRLMTNHHPAQAGHW